MKLEYLIRITYSDGKYTVEYSYILHPPIEYDSTTSHLNLKFAGGSHIPYRNIRITIPAKNVEQVYAYPPFMGVRNDGDTYTITGSAAADENVAVELLATVDGLSGIPGIRTEVADLKSKTASGSFWYNLPYFVANLLNILAKAGVILVPILLIYLYYHYGREKMFTVPEYLSTIPNPSLKPWQVNLLFKDDALDFDEDGYYATLLELHRRKIIHITEKGTGKGIEIQILSTATSDPYELRVLAFIQQLSENDVLDTDKIEALAKKAQSNQHCRRKGIAVPADAYRCDIQSRCSTPGTIHCRWTGTYHSPPVNHNGPVCDHTHLCIRHVHAILYPYPGSYSLGSCACSGNNCYRRSLDPVWTLERRQIQGKTGMGCIFPFPF